ncbi:hypothetical protein FRB95_013259 [Tulasnella sp. JGI-2019a]|nr:hypothetical protein FRB95_013259 [Tulasnella sp. JGI-2019a]
MEVCNGRVSEVEETARMAYRMEPPPGPKPSAVGSTATAAFGNVYNIISASSKGDLDSAILHAAAIALTIQQVTTEIAVANALDQCIDALKNQTRSDQEAINKALKDQQAADAAAQIRAVASAVANATVKAQEEMQRQIDAAISRTQIEAHNNQTAVCDAMIASALSNHQNAGGIAPGTSFRSNKKQSLQDSLEPISGPNNQRAMGQVSSGANEEVTHRGTTTKTTLANAHATGTVTGKHRSTKLSSSFLIDESSPDGEHEQVSSLPIKTVRKKKKKASAPTPAVVDASCPWCWPVDIGERTKDCNSKTASDMESMIIHLQ